MHTAKYVEIEPN